MVAPALSEAIEKQLHGLSKLRGSVDPREILEAVESVMASIAADHSSLNGHLYDEIEALANYIKTAKGEIPEIKADKINTEVLPEASDQLNAIVGATEQATNDIFEAVESIEGLTADMEPKMAEQVTEAVTRVYEACGFQDITGQRISKVVRALQHVEVKIQALLQAFGEEIGTARPETGSDPSTNGAAAACSDEDLIHGPQLPGAGISQDDVDALLANVD